jgi:hypothetical protein
VWDFNIPIAILLCAACGVARFLGFLPSTTQEKPKMTQTISAVISNDRPATERDTLRILAIGSREGITETIHTLHRLGFADAGAWSPLLPVPNSNDLMSILTRHRQR